MSTAGEANLFVLVKCGVGKCGVRDVVALPRHVGMGSRYRYSSLKLKVKATKYKYKYTIYHIHIQADFIHYTSTSINDPSQLVQLSARIASESVTNSPIFALSFSLFAHATAMSGWMSYLVGSRKSKQDGARDAIVGLRTQLLMLEKKEEHLNKKIEDEMKKARANASSNKRCKFRVSVREVLPRMRSVRSAAIYADRGIMSPGG